MPDTPPPENMKPPPSASEEPQEEEAGGTEAVEAQKVDAPASEEEAAAEGEDAAREDEEVLEECSEEEEGGGEEEYDAEWEARALEDAGGDPAIYEDMVAMGAAPPRRKVPPQELPSGAVVDLGVGGKVTVESRLCRGGMAEVYAGILTTAEGCRQRVALKRVQRGMNEKMAGRFVDEARVQACMAHRNVARLHGFYDVEDDRFILMEYVEGRSLRDLFNLARSRDKSLSPDAACWLLAEVADALHAVHHAADVEGRPLHVVHRDVSPENVIVDANGRPVLVDFGVALSTMPGRIATADGNQTWLGKVPYLAPEQARFGRVDARADLWALGCILVEAFTGQTPFGNNDIITIHRINQVTPKWVDAVTGGVPPAVKAICHRLLQHAPDQRYAHGHELAEALRACLTKPFGESKLLAEIAWLEGLLHRHNAESKMELLPPEPVQPPAPPPSPEVGSGPAPEAVPAPVPAPVVAPAPAPVALAVPEQRLSPPPRRFQSPWLLVGMVLLACACTAGLTWFAARSGQPGTAVPGMAATTPPAPPAVPPAPAPPEPTREKLAPPETQQAEGSSNVKANPPPTTPDEATSPPEEVEKKSKKKLTPAQCFAKACAAGYLSVLLACHGSLQAGTCPEPTSKRVPGQGQYKRLKPVGMVEYPSGAQFITPRECYEGDECPALQGAVMLEVHDREHPWRFWKLTGTARILWGDETVTWEGGERIKAVGRWVVLFHELRESDAQSLLNERRWPVCGTLVGMDGKEGIPLLSETLQADWSPDSFVQLFY